VVVDPEIVSASNVGGGWKIVQGSVALIDFGANAAGAAHAVAVIQHYHFTRECFVRRPNAAMMYWKNGNAVPPGNMPDQDCIALDPASVQVQSAGGNWRVVNGATALLDFGLDRGAADQAIAAIRTFRFNRECFIARPHVEMQYWLAE
jgi:hypothetical protein